VSAETRARRRGCLQLGGCRSAVRGGDLSDRGGPPVAGIRLPRARAWPDRPVAAVQLSPVARGGRLRGRV